MLSKWNSNDPSVLDKILEDLRDFCEVHTKYSKTLGVEWNAATDQFQLNISKPPSVNKMTKRNIVSTHIPRCYLSVGFSVGFSVFSMQLLGFSDASEEAYTGVVHLHLVDSTGKVHTAIVMSKTRVSPIKRLSIPRLELCGAQLMLTKLLCHVKKTLNVPVTSVFAWTDSTIVLSWLTGNPRRFKIYIGNQISFIVDQLPPDRCKHVPGTQNPADCASRGLLPLQLKDYIL